MGTIKVSIDCGGFNYREEEFSEGLIKDLSLNPIQVFQIKSGKEVKVGTKTFIQRIDYED